MKELSIEEENLLYKDLYSRVPYGVICKCYHTEHAEWDGKPFIATYDLTVYSIDPNGIVFADGFDFEIDEVRPYLRPMSSMTEEEIHEFQEILGPGIEVGYGFVDILDSSVHTFSFLELQALFDWLNANHFDYRNLISKELALEAHEGIYK
jgi:hypothetical protein